MTEHSARRLFDLRTYRRFFQEGAWIIAGHSVVVLVGLFGIRLLTELAPTEVYGEASLLLSALGLGLNIFVSPITATQVRFHSEYRQAGTANQFTHMVIRWAVIAALLLSVCVIGIYEVWCTIERQSANTLLLGLAIAWLLVLSVRNVLIGRLNAERQQARYAIWLSAEAILTTGLTALALLFWARTELYVTGQLAGTALALLIFLFVMSQSEKDRGGTPGPVSNVFRQRVVTYGLPFAPLSLLGWLSNLADRYVLAFFLGTAVTGQYLAAFGIASRAMLIMGAVSNDVLRPMLFDAESSRQPKRARKIFLTWLGLVVSGGAVILTTIVLGGRWITDLLLAESYRARAVEVMLWIGIGYAAFAVVQVLENRLLSLGRSRRLILPKVLGGFANIGLSIVLITRNGVIGAAQASAVSFGLQLVLTGVMLWRTHRADVAST